MFFVKLTQADHGIGIFRVFLDCGLKIWLGLINIAFLNIALAPIPVDIVVIRIDSLDLCETILGFLSIITADVILTEKIYRIDIIFVEAVQF